MSDGLKPGPLDQRHRAAGANRICITPSETPFYPHAFAQDSLRKFSAWDKTRVPDENQDMPGQALPCATGTAVRPALKPFIQQFFPTHKTPTRRQR